MPLYIDDRYNSFRLLAVDPGKHHLGASVHEINSRTGEYIRIDIETIRMEKLYRSHLTDPEFTSVTDSCLLKIRNHIYDVCNDYDITFFAYESPFYNPRMPGAYGSLCEVVACCRQAALDANPTILIDCMSPQNIKKGMGAGGTKGKEIMLEKVSQNMELMQVLQTPIEELTEHCIDSLAVGLHARNTIIRPMEGWNQQG